MNLTGFQLQEMAPVDFHIISLKKRKVLFDFKKKTTDIM